MIWWYWSRWTWSWSVKKSRMPMMILSLYILLECGRKRSHPLLVGSFLAIWLVQFPVIWLVGDITHFYPLLGWVWEQIRRGKGTSGRTCALKRSIWTSYISDVWIFTYRLKSMYIRSMQIKNSYHHSQKWWVLCSFAYLRWRRRDVCNFYMIYIDDIIHNCMCVIFWTWKWYIESSWIKWNKN